MHDAFLAGRMETDPSANWYNGEMRFFDFYIIPLAKKLKNCGVFGVSSDEYLQYAIQNRHEWKIQGPRIVQEFIANVTMKKTKQPLRDDDDGGASNNNMPERAAVAGISTPHQQTTPPPPPPPTTGGSDGDWTQ
jgi:hypothetical protein